MSSRVSAAVLTSSVLFSVMADRAAATFHFMQIEQVIGGVNGDTAAQAIQLRMRTVAQNLVAQGRVIAHDAAGLNPIMIIDLTTNVANGSLGDRVLITSAGFDALTTPAAAPDFTMTNLIPSSYLAAGSLTFESDFGVIYWRLSWGGGGYTGSNSGAIDNDADGNFGPPFAGPLPSSSLQALRFTGTASAPSTTNAADYAVTAGAATFRNNAGTGFLLTGPVVLGACCDLAADDCVDNVAEADCQGAEETWTAETLCADLDPPCTSTGACCDLLTGTCGLALAAECGDHRQRFGGPGSTCADFDFPCDIPISIGLDPVAGGGAGTVAGGGTLTAPLMVTHAGDGSGRLFVVDQIGQIRVIDADGNLLPTPFLDIQSKLVNVGIDFGGGFVFDERGLLGLAFHPDYANNGRFFVRYSAPRSSTGTEPCDAFPGECHAEILAEYAVTGDPTTNNVADGTSEVILFSADEPHFNHNSGHVAFGPDGLLYWTLGDGGGAHDGLADVPPSHGPDGNGQNPETPLGNILRIDVDCLTPPCVPAGNPFAGGCPPEFPSCVPEIYAYGFRNPYRFSFGQVGGSDVLIVGDVGQALLEEVDFVPVLASPGFLNYGWVIREGTNCFDPLNPTVPPVSCATTGPLTEPLIDPEFEYGHGIGIAVIGGYIYEGSYPALQGRYVFGDFSQDFGPTGRLFYADVEGPEAFVMKEFFLAPDGLPLNQAMFGLGVGEDGEMYVCASDNIGPVGDTGVVYRIVAPAPAQSTLAARYVSIEPPPSPEPYALAVTPDCAGGPGTVAVGTSGLEFVPADVTISTGESVHWTGLGGGFHTVAEVDDATAMVYNGGFHSPPGASEFTFTFNDPGVYYYICEPHVGAGMRGTVTVTDPVRYLDIPADVVTNTGPERIAFLVSDPNDAARLTSDQWGPVVHATGLEIYPETGYKIQTDFGTAGSPVLSGPALATTNRRGDVVAPFAEPGQPNFVDIGEIVNKFKDLFTAQPLHRTDQVGSGGSVCPPDAFINFQDINAAVEAFKSIPFACPGPCG